MDVSAAEPDHAWASHAAYRGDDPRAAHPADCNTGRGRARVFALCGLIALLSADPAGAETLRLATFHTDLTGRGPGTVLRDVVREEDRVAATLAVILEADADILALQDIDFDAGGATVSALVARLAEGGLDYPHQVVLRPNTGWLTGFDLDGDGRTDGPRDAHGYGRFNGEGGMALLSRFPIGQVRDFSALPWVELPDGTAADVTPAEALSTLRLHSVGAWDVEILTPDGPLHILMSHASPPVFDGPEDRNGLRNADELRFWQLYLDGWEPVDGEGFDATRFAVMGTFNIDPERGEGRREGLEALLLHPALQDPGPNTPTADWEEPAPGNLRVDYILPSASLPVLSSGILWPEDGPLAEVVAEASDHRLVWVDLDL